MRFRAVITAAAVLLATVVTTLTPAHAGLEPIAPKLPTPWTADVDKTLPHPEYPRPQLKRGELVNTPGGEVNQPDWSKEVKKTDWENLNGQWQFDKATDLNTPPIGKDLPETVLVPFPVESELSMLKRDPVTGTRHENNMWYRRTFAVPAEWKEKGERVQLNFGAVNWEAKVWVNGTSFEPHRGGYDSFSFDITDALKKDGSANEIIVGVHSPVDAKGIPVGKQRLKAIPKSIWYTPSSGIWQTVWLEPTKAAHITRLDTTPNLPAGALDLVPQVSGTADGVKAEVFDKAGKWVGDAIGKPGQSLRISIPNANLWTLKDPYLYNLRVTLTGAGGGDTVNGYFGMRSIGKKMVDGKMRPVLNGKFVYQLGTLDQGYWPDGISTAPTDAALKFDLDEQKKLGFNMVRKHIKVEPARWYYHADTLGLMVWQDMPSMKNRDHDPKTGAELNQFVPSADDQTQFKAEMKRMIDQLKGITSIVWWIPQNEGWGEFDQAGVADLVKKWDPTRLVTGMSGYNIDGSTDAGHGDAIDIHNYPGPGPFIPLPTSTRVSVLGEYGGFGLKKPDNQWSADAYSPYEMASNEEELTRQYVTSTSQLRDLISSRGLSASVYTEVTDVENEVNGFYTYDRRLKKMDFAKVKEVNDAVIAAADGSQVPENQLMSLKVATTGYTDRSLSTSGGLGVTSVIDSSSSEAAKKDGSFWTRPGLADANCVSFESRSKPGEYLRHLDYRVRQDAKNDTSQFKNDATFCPRAEGGLNGGGTSFESYNVRGRYLRHFKSDVYIANSSGTNAWDNPASFDADATWATASPWWRSGIDLPTGQAKSLQVVTPGYTDRYLRHTDSLGDTEVVTSGSDATLKADATFTIRPGLADPSCYSLESRNYPGHYLRHKAFRVHKDADDGTDLFDADATFCAQPGRYGTGDMTLASYNTGLNIRHYQSKVWIAYGGSFNYDTPILYKEDTTWRLAAPWTP